MRNKQVLWLNVAKFIAMLAVMIDHSYDFLYNDYNVALMSYCSVSIFILLSGITAYWSNERVTASIGYSWLAVLKKRIGKIFVPYMIATVIYQIVEKKGFDISLFFFNLMNFNAGNHFYYIFLYIQLLIVSPVLYMIIKKIQYTGFEKICYVILFFIIVFLASWTTNNTQIMSIYGGGGKILGGTFIIMYFLGMLSGKYMMCNNDDVIAKYNIAGSVVLGILYIVWSIFYLNDRFYLDSMLPFGQGLNPPGISLGVSAVLLTGFLYYIVSFISITNFTILKNFCELLGYFGTHTLYIFIYHWLIVVDFLRPFVHFDNIVFQFIIHFCIMIFGSIIIEQIADRFKILFLKYIRII